MIVLTTSKATKRRNRIQGAPRPLHAWQRCKFVLCKSQDEIILFLSLLRNEPECQIRIQIKSLVELSSTSRGMLAENVSEDNSIVNICSGHLLSPPQLIAFWALSSSHAKIQLTQCLFADIWIELASWCHCPSLDLRFLQIGDPPQRSYGPLRWEDGWQFQIERDLPHKELGPWRWDGKTASFSRWMRTIWMFRKNIWARPNCKRRFWIDRMILVKWVCEVVKYWIKIADWQPLSVI